MNIEPDYRENIKNSFLRVKEHIKLLEEEIRANREFIIKQNNQIIFLLERLKSKDSGNPPKSAELSPKEASSSGNEGVYSLTHSLNKHSLTHYALNELDASTRITPDYVAPEKEQTVQKIEDNQDINDDPLDIEILERPFEIKRKPKTSKIIKFHGLRREIVEMFENLSKQELLTFLTIYQLEEDIKKVTYTHLAEKLKLSEACIRHYVSFLIKKGAPVEKNRYNNKLIFLTISTGFRDLNLKKQLMVLYYRSDPSQPTLHESY